MSRRKWTEDKLFFRLMNNKSDRTYWENISELRSRPSTETFTKCVALANSDLPKERKLAIDILAQLGTTPRLFYKESISLYFNLLKKEKNTEVLSSILYAVGHNNDDLNQVQIESLVALKDHSSNSVREALAFALFGLNNKLAIHALVQLSDDKSTSVRDWATFGIGQCDEDTEVVKKALWDRRNDKNQNTKLEAIVGLAKRQDLRVKQIIQQELKGGEYGSLIFEAIELINGVEFIPLLKKNLDQGAKDPEINPEWLHDLKALIIKLESSAG